MKTKTPTTAPTGESKGDRSFYADSTSTFCELPPGMSHQYHNEQSAGRSWNRHEYDTSVGMGSQINTEGLCLADGAAEFAREQERLESLRWKEEHPELPVPKPVVPEPEPVIPQSPKPVTPPAPEPVIQPAPKPIIPPVPQPIRWKKYKICLILVPVLLIVVVAATITAVLLKSDPEPTPNNIPPSAPTPSPASRPSSPPPTFWPSPTLSPVSWVLPPTLPPTFGAGAAPPTNPPTIGAAVPSAPASVPTSPIATDPNSTRGLELVSTCGEGNIGNRVCADGACCSQWGWCGWSAEYCGEDPLAEGLLAEGLLAEGPLTGLCEGNGGACGCGADDNGQVIMLKHYWGDFSDEQVYGCGGAFTLSGDEFGAQWGAILGPEASIVRSLGLEFLQEHSYFGWEDCCFVCGVNLQIAGKISSGWYCEKDSITGIWLKGVHIN